VAQELGLMSQKEVLRHGAINRVTQAGLEQGQAAMLSGLSARQVKRLCRRMREQGAQGLISRKRGQPRQAADIDPATRTLRANGTQPIRRLWPTAGL
jgi:transposase